MFIAVLLPTIFAAARPCADYKPVNLHISYTTIATSPDCRWQVVSLGDDDIAIGASSLILSHSPPITPASRYRAFVIDRQSDKAIYQFEMERSASLHWLHDNRHLVVNYFAGAGSDIPLFFTLKAGKTRLPANLAARVYTDAVRRVPVQDRRPYGVSRQIYHYYVNFIEDTGGDVLISAEPWYILHGYEGEGASKCFIYSVSKTTLRYSFVREDNIDNCPRNPDEKRN